jgi:hypothetical protein
MAPEQAAGRSDTDGRVDIYALGVILYEMLCGRVPHKGDSMVRTLAMQMLDPVEPLSKVRPDLNIAPELEQVVMLALAKKRDQRYQTMSELLTALDKVAKEVLPAPVGQSVTGSPVYALSPLPPGADPSIVASQHAATPASGVLATPPPPDSAAAVARAHPISQGPPTGRRMRDEPEFVTNTARAISFDHVTTEDMPVASARRWPLVLFGALILGGAAGAVGLVLKSRSDVDRVVEHRDAAVPLADAAIIAEIHDAPGDADISDGPADAEVVVVISVDAGHYTPVPTRDAGIITATIPDTPNHRGTFPIQILTKPEGANLYDGYTYRGPGGTTIEASPGTRLEITCKQPGYQPGTVQLVFDGRTDVVLCVAKRIKICVDNIKNPFDDCELDPNKPAPEP